MEIIKPNNQNLGEFFFNVEEHSDFFKIKQKISFLFEIQVVSNENSPVAGVRMGWMVWIQLWERSPHTAQAMVTI